MVSCNALVAVTVTGVPSIPAVACPESLWHPPLGNSFLAMSNRHGADQAGRELQLRLDELPPCPPEFPKARRPLQGCRLPPPARAGPNPEKSAGNESAPLKALSSGSPRFCPPRGRFGTSEIFAEVWKAIWHVAGKSRGLRPVPGGEKRAGGPGLKPVPPAEAFGAMPLPIDTVPGKKVNPAS